MESLGFDSGCRVWGHTETWGYTCVCRCIQGVAYRYACSHYHTLNFNHSMSLRVGIHLGMYRDMYRDVYGEMGLYDGDI